MNKHTPHKITAFLRSAQAYFQSRPDLALLAILAVAYTSFIPCLFNSFVNWDDQVFVLKNPLIYAAPLTNLKDILLSHFMGLYYPLTILVFQIEHFFFGLYPPAYHLVNLILHLLNVALVFQILLALRLDWRVCSITALLFAVHPLQVESVAWISSLKDLLFAFFYFSAVLFYLKKAAALPNGKNQMILSLLFGLALSSKITAITLPFTLLLLDFWRNQRLERRDGISKIPLFLLAGAFAAINILTVYLDQACPFSKITTSMDRLWLSGMALWLYLAKIVFPFHLCVIHPLPLTDNGLYPWNIYAGTFAVIILLGGMLKKFYRSPLLLPLAFFLLTLAPGLHLVKTSNCLIYERYVYLPSVGIFLLFSLGFLFIFSRIKPALKPILAFLGIAYLLFLCGSSWIRSGVWKNGETLWTDAIRKFPHQASAYSNRAAYYLERQEYGPALSDAETCIALYPKFAEGYMLRGDLYERLARFPEALGDYTRALDLGLTYSNDQMMVLNNRGNIHARLGRNDLAIADYTKILTQDPNDLYALLNRGISYSAQKDWGKAVADLEAALRLDPKNLFAAESLKALRKKIKEKP